MSKKMNYKEFLEVVSIDLIEKYKIKIETDGSLGFGENNNTSFKLGNAIKYNETNTVWKIKTKTVVATFWKNVEYSYLMIL